MYKKIFTLLVLFFTSASLIYGQSLKFGLKAGTDMHKLEGKSFKEQFTFGYHAGAFVEVGLSSKLSIQPEVYFSEVKVDTGTSFSQTYQFKQVPKIKFSYINIPILLNIKPNKFLALQLGPQYGILINNNISLINNGRDAFKNGDFSAVAGVQVYVARFRIYGRYVVGLSDLNDIDDREKWKTQTIHLGLAVKF